jgi:hypothetical protein
MSTPGSRSQDIDDAFFPKLEEVASQLEADPLHVLSVMFSESTCRADAWNDNQKDLPPDKRYNDSGLIQFMPATLKLLGWTQGHAAFRRLSATAQLPYVRAYYRSYVGHLGSIAGLYVATFLPSLVSRAGDRDFVLTARKGPLGWAYAPNAAFDRNKDLAITVGELEDAVRRNCVGARWADLVARLRGAPVASDSNEHAVALADLRTILGIQTALSTLGLDPGPRDGYAGPRTTRAVVSFQRSRGLAPDGIVGPLTRAALEDALKEKNR